MALHIILLREHNRLADQIHAAEPGLSDEQIIKRFFALIDRPVIVESIWRFGRPMLAGQQYADCGCSTPLIISVAYPAEFSAYTRKV